jgi:hypothetical protein
VKVIVSSADIQDGTASKARALGASAFVPKPVDAEELRRVIRLVLAQTVAPAELPIDPRYADAFREIFNIGIGRAAARAPRVFARMLALAGLSLAAVTADVSTAAAQPGGQGVEAIQHMFRDPAIANYRLTSGNLDKFIRATTALKALEEEGDAIYAQAVGALFAGTPDPLEVLKWKELYDKLEDAIDLCDDVSNVLESIALKNG